MEEWKKWYVGGLWDADGSFGISKHHVKIWVTYQPFAIITLCDPKAETVFKLIEEEFGFACIARTNRGNKKWRTAHVWQIVSQKACDFAKVLEPFLLIKKGRAQILMEWPKKPQAYKSMNKEERNAITQKQEELYQQMKILNKRGS